MNKVVAACLIGAWVRNKKAVTWADVRVPAGTRGTIIQVYGNTSVSVDFGPRYGAFQLWWREISATKVR